MLADARTHAQEVFLRILGPLMAHALFAFRYIHNEHDREDFVQESVCVAWKWTVRLIEQGRDPREFPTGIAQNATRHVRGGRKFAGGKTGTRDVLSRRAQTRHGFTVTSLPSSTAAPRERLYGEPGGQQTHDAAEEFLCEHDRSPVPEQVAFRIDFHAWHAMQDPRRREILDAMIREERTQDLAETFGISPGRISQLRREFEAAWRAYWGE